MRIKGLKLYNWLNCVLSSESTWGNSVLHSAYSEWKQDRMLQIILEQLKHRLCVEF